MDFAAGEDEATPVRFRNLKDIYSSCSFALTAADPTTYEEEIKDEMWIKAMNEEIDAIQRNRTWELTLLPEKMKAVGLKWIFKSKFNSYGTLLKKKARLVAKGFLQWEGIDLMKCSLLRPEWRQFYYLWHSVLRRSGRYINLMLNQRF